LGFGNSSKSGKKVQKLRREHNSHQIGWRKKIWTVGFYVQEKLRRSAQKGRS
jgi:hypothetical protein